MGGLGLTRWVLSFCVLGILKSQVPAISARLSSPK